MNFTSGRLSPFQTLPVTQLNKKPSSNNMLTYNTMSDHLYNECSGGCSSYMYSDMLEGSAAGHDPPLCAPDMYL